MWRITYLALLILSSCGGPPDISNANGTESARAQPSYKPVTGYGNVELGTSFESAIGSLDAKLFNPYSLKDCFKDLALHGCTLQRNDEDTVFDLHDGIPFGLVLDFNKSDRLTDVRLVYNRKHNITSKECNDILSRAVDWISADYGPIDVNQASGNDVSITTSQGHTFRLMKPDASGNYTSDFMRTHSVAKQRYVEIFATYILKQCEVQINFSEPKSVKRPDYDAGIDGALEGSEADS